MSPCSVSGVFFIIGSHCLHIFFDLLHWRLRSSGIFYSIFSVVYRRVDRCKPFLIQCSRTAGMGYVQGTGNCTSANAVIDFREMKDAFWVRIRLTLSWKYFGHLRVHFFVTSEVELDCQGFFKLGKQLSVNGSIVLDEPFFYFVSHLPFDFSLFVSLRFSLGWIVEDETFEKVLD